VSLPTKLRTDSVVVDSELAKESNIDGVQEMLNGCLCCTLVGRMADALLELKGTSFIHARSHVQKNTIQPVSSSRLRGAPSPLQSQFKSDNSPGKIRASTSTPSSPSLTASTFADTRYPPRLSILTRRIHPTQQNSKPNTPT
jgi:hypothetical protein